MAYIKQLDSGLWYAEVKIDGKRDYFTDPLKSVVEAWAEEQETDIRRGDWINPRLARTTIGECWDRFAGSRRLEKASRKRDESVWKCHVAPRWGRVAVGSVLKPDVRSWVNTMEDNGVGGWTIIAAVNVLKAILECAVDAGMIRSNPARRVKTPLPPKHIDRLIEPEEEDLLLARLDEMYPGRIDGRPFVEFMIESGARWEEAAAVRREWIDLRRGVARLGPVMERDGTIREYPKGARGEHSAGFRTAPLSDGLLARLRPVVLATAAGQVIFTAPMGGVLFYSTWLHRVWQKAMRIPALDERGKRLKGEDGKPLWTPLLPPPLPTPHDCRHTFGTRLGDAGVERHDVQAAMGHEDYRSSARYVNSDEEKRLARIREAMRRTRETRDHHPAPSGMILRNSASQ